MVVERYCPARWIRRKVVSFESFLLKGESRRFSANFARPTSCQSSFKLQHHLVAITVGSFFSANVAHSFSCAFCHTLIRNGAMKTFWIQRFFFDICFKNKAQAFCPFFSTHEDIKNSTVLLSDIFNFFQDSITKKWSCGKDAAGTWKKYYGRGAKQLSYNFNYGQFSQV
jgi:hypothetical protein